MTMGEGQVTVAEVRSRITAGDVAIARPMYEALHGRLGPITDVLVVEGLLNEAEGDLEAAAASFQRALAGAPGSVFANAQSARICLQLGRLLEAEQAALATLRLDAGNLNGLKVLADVYARTGRLEERADVVYRLGLCPGLSGAATWTLVSELSVAGRWTEVLEILDRRGAELIPKRVASTRVETLLDLGRQRDALACLLAALADGHVQPKDVVDRLIARNALAVGAAFIKQSIADGHSGPNASAPLVAAARRTCNGITLQDSPFDFADAVRALEILLPDHEPLGKAVERSALFLVKRGRSRLIEGDYGAATDDLIRAGRIRPEDRAILELLADAALRAGRAHRHFDTLLRIHRIFADGRSLVAAARAAFSAANWTSMGDLISQAEAGVRASSAETIEQFRLQLRRNLESLLREGHYEAGLAMVTGLKPWLDIADWPGPSIQRLLARTKRHLRGLRAFADTAAMNRLCSLYALVDPGDVDVGRLLARLHFRYRRFSEAVEVLTRVMEADPHSARDWLDLALARQELGQPALRDVCVARAIVISPTIVLPKPLEAFRARMFAA